MPVNLKNYTSEVAADRSLARIEKKLVEAGASDISKSYENGVCTVIRFRLSVKGIPVFFELPAKVEQCFTVLWSERQYSKNETNKQKTREQAERTAWKIIAEWVEIQISMVMLEQAELMQVFLPYVFDPATNETFYNRLKNTNFKGLLSNG